MENLSEMDHHKVISKMSVLAIFTLRTSKSCPIPYLWRTIKKLSRTGHQLMIRYKSLIDSSVARKSKSVLFDVLESLFRCGWSDGQLLEYLCPQRTSFWWSRTDDWSSVVGRVATIQWIATLNSPPRVVDLQSTEIMLSTPPGGPLVCRISPHLDQS